MKPIKKAASTTTKPVIHHSLVVEALNKDIPGYIHCRSKEEMESLFQEIISHYNSRVVVQLGRELTAFLWLIPGAKSRTAREYGITHHVIVVGKMSGRAGDGKDYWRIQLKSAGSYKVAAEMRAACID